MWRHRASDVVQEAFARALSKPPRRAERLGPWLGRVVRNLSLQELRSQGRELAEGIRAAADREVTVIKAGAYRDAQTLRGEGDARAAAIYAGAFEQDPDFFGFTRSLQAYRESFQSKGDLLLIEPDSEFFRYLKEAQGSE